MKRGYNAGFPIERTAGGRAHGENFGAVADFFDHLMKQREAAGEAAGGGRALALDDSSLFVSGGRNHLGAADVESDNHLVHFQVFKHSAFRPATRKAFLPL